jgi:hypothetical protein
VYYRYKPTDLTSYNSKRPVLAPYIPGILRLELGVLYDKHPSNLDNSGIEARIVNRLEPPPILTNP